MTGLLDRLARRVPDIQPIVFDQERSDDWREMVESATVTRVALVAVIDESAPAKQYLTRQDIEDEHMARLDADPNVRIGITH